MVDHLGRERSGADVHLARLVRCSSDRIPTVNVQPNAVRSRPDDPVHASIPRRDSLADGRLHRSGSRGREQTGPLALGTLLFIFGAMVEAMAWSYLPIWYHVIFLALLIPVTALGGKMKSSGGLR